MCVSVKITMFDESRNLLESRANEHYVPDKGDYISLKVGETRRVLCRQFVYQTGVTQVTLTLSSTELL